MSAPSSFTDFSRRFRAADEQVVGARRMPLTRVREGVGWELDLDEDSHE